MKARAPKFKEGDAVVFKRDTEYSRQWEPGSYVATVDFLGQRPWHRVRAPSGETFRVPMQRLRLAEGDPRPR